MLPLETKGGKAAKRKQVTHGNDNKRKADTAKFDGLKQITLTQNVRIMAQKATVPQTVQSGDTVHPQTISTVHQLADPHTSTAIQQAVLPQAITSAQQQAAPHSNALVQHPIHSQVSSTQQSSDLHANTAIQVPIHPHAISTVQQPAAFHTNTAVQQPVFPQAISSVQQPAAPYSSSPAQQPGQSHVISPAQQPMFPQSNTIAQQHPITTTQLHPVLPHNISSSQQPAILHASTAIQVPIHSHAISTVQQPAALHTNTAVPLPAHFQTIPSTQQPAGIHAYSLLPQPVHSAHHTLTPPAQTTVQLPVHFQAIPSAHQTAAPHSFSSVQQPFQSHVISPAHQPVAPHSSSSVQQPSQSHVISPAQQPVFPQSNTLVQQHPIPTAQLPAASLDNTANQQPAHFQSIPSAQQPTDPHANTSIQQPAASPDVFWYFVLELPTAEVVKVIDDEKIWSKSKVINLENGEKKMYRCNLVRLRGPQCAAARYTVTTFGSDLMSFFTNNMEHTHDEINNKSKILNPVIRKFIVDNIKHPTRTIVRMIKESSGVDVKASQVQSVKDYEKKKASGESSKLISISGLETFCNNNSTIPNDDDEAFVIGAEFSGPLTPADDKFFRIVYSTKRLLRHCTLSDNFHADGTFKILIQGYPLLVVGITDTARKFHLGAMAVCSGETEGDYQFIFATIKNAIQLVTNLVFEPKYLIADFAAAITNGHSKAFNHESVRIHCYYHLKSHTTKYKFAKSDNNALVNSDISKLQLASSKHLFDIGWRLFKIKWEGEEAEFVKYFEENYIAKNHNWFEGVAGRTPSTNNALEGFNSSIKKVDTQRIREPFQQFVVSCLKIVQNRSGDYASYPGVETEYKFDDDTLLKGWEYFIGNKEIEAERLADGIVVYYMFRAGIDGKVTKDKILEWKKHQYKDFNDFVEHSSDIYEITYDQGKPWSKMTCTCTAYFKFYACKHIVCMAHKLRALHPPLELLKKKELVLPKKGRRGRPAKAKKGLIVQ